MLLGRKVHFEVQAKSDNRWTVYSSSPYKDAAIDQARVLLSSGSVDAVKVTREGGMKEGEDVVFQEDQSGGLPPVSWSTPIVSRGGSRYGNQATQTGRDRHQATTG